MQTQGKTELQIIAEARTATHSRIRAKAGIALKEFHRYADSHHGALMGRMERPGYRDDTTAEWLESKIEPATAALRTAIAARAEAAAEAAEAEAAAAAAAEAEAAEAEARAGLSAAARAALEAAESLEAEAAAGAAERQRRHNAQAEARAEAEAERDMWTVRQIEIEAEEKAAHVGSLLSADWQKINKKVAARLEEERAAFAAA